jgi:N-acetylglucosaminyldiphosphoundecaprenol N-acetyl-beta-D-mannosaminyltransferase
MTIIRLEHLSLAGMTIDLLTLRDLLDLLEMATATQDKYLVLHHNLHSIYLYHTVADIKSLYSHAFCVYIDGIPVVWLSKFAGLPARLEHRVTLLDSFQTVLGKAEVCGWRVFYLGSRPRAIARGLAMIRKQFPQLTISGHHGYFSKTNSECDDVISKINDFGPDILFVGMGMPIQERWLYTHLSRLNARVILTCGATLDYITGEAYRPPSWVGPLGLYGVFRLLAAPERLWRRYLVEPIALIMYLFVPLVRQRLQARHTKWL